MTQYLTAILPVIFGWLPGYQVGYQGTKAQSPRLFRSPQVPRANRCVMYADTFCPKSVNLAKAGNILYAQKNKLSSLLHVLFCFLSHWSFGVYLWGWWGMGVGVLLWQRDRDGKTRYFGLTWGINTGHQ